MCVAPRHSRRPPRCRAQGSASLQQIPISRKRTISMTPHQSHQTREQRSSCDLSPAAGQPDINKVLCQDVYYTAGPEQSPRIERRKYSVPRYASSLYIDIYAGNHPGPRIPLQRDLGSDTSGSLIQFRGFVADNPRFPGLEEIQPTRLRRLVRTAGVVLLQTWP